MRARRHAARARGRALQGEGLRDDGGRGGRAVLRLHRRGGALRLAFQNRAEFLGREEVGQFHGRVSLAQGATLRRHARKAFGRHGRAHDLVIG